MHQQSSTAQQQQKPIVGQCTQITNNGHSSMSHTPIIFEARPSMSHTPIIFEARPFCWIAIPRCRGLVHQIPGLACSKRMGRQAGKSRQWNEAAFVIPASTWFNELEPEVSSDVQKLDSAFRDRFTTNQPAWVLEQQLWGRTMQPTEGLDAYITAIDSPCARLQRSLI